MKLDVKFGKQDVMQALVQWILDLVIMYLYTTSFSSLLLCYFIRNTKPSEKLVFLLLSRTLYIQNSLSFTKYY